MSLLKRSTRELTPEILSLSKLLWDYHHMDHQLKKADCILVLGSHDTRVADWGIDLFKRGYAPYIVFSGGLGSLTKDVFKKSEAETFADLALKRGVPKDKIIIENQSTNTGENIQFTETLLVKLGHEFNSFILVQKPYMERRGFSTFRKQLPEKNCIVTSPPIPYEKYFTQFRSKDDIINIIVGDLQRIIEYSKRGYQISQDVPEQVRKAYDELIKRGYTKRLIQDEERHG